MKRETIWNNLIGAGLSWMLSAAAVGCMITAFGLQVDDEGKLMLLCAGVSFFAAFCFSFRWGDWVLVGLLALTAGYLWHEGTIWEHIAALLQCVTRRYDMAYGWGVVGLSGFDGKGPVDLALGIVVCFAAVSVSWVTVRRENALWAMPAVILPLVSCLIVTDTVPGALWLYLLMLGVVLLLLTDYVRRKGTRQAVRMTLYAALPAAAALGLLFLLTPQDSYVNQAEEYEARLMVWGQNALDLAQDAAQDITAGLTGETPDEAVDLSRVGPQSQWNTVVLEVTSSVGGRVYLREQDYDTYDGTGWTASSHRAEQFGGGTEIGTLTVRTRGRRSNLLLPYYPAEAQTLIGGSADNDEKQTEYTFALSAPPESSQPADVPDGYVFATLENLAKDVDTNRYRTLPNRTAAWAKELAAEITAGKTENQSSAQAIADYVRNSAAYDLKTARMPSEETDFARWFLEESDTGYCVHFATATAVLLRAAGIPARYVTGYLVDCAAGETAEVPEKAAHAWVEYYDGSRNAWIVLESTPADSAADVSSGNAEGTGAPERETGGASEPAPAETDAPTEASAPPETGGEGPATAETPEWSLPGWGKVLLWCLLVSAVLFVQSLLRRQIVKLCWNRGGPNEKALARWSHLCGLSRLLGQEMPAELTDLAEKARFSQHTLTERELAAFDERRRELLAGLRKKNVFLRIFYGLVLAVW